MSEMRTQRNPFQPSLIESPQPTAKGSPVITASGDGSRTVEESGVRPMVSITPQMSARSKPAPTHAAANQNLGTEGGVKAGTAPTAAVKLGFVAHKITGSTAMPKAKVEAI